MFRSTRSVRRDSPPLVLVVAAILAAPALSEEGDSARHLREYAQVPAAAAVDSNSRPAQLEASSSPPGERLLVYRPPRRGAPRAKVSGGVRGARALPTPLVLTPPHLAETVTAQPSLFWHIDAVPGEGSSLVFTLIDSEGIDPVVEVTLAPLQRAGIQRIRLANQGVSLEPEIEYEWSIALVVDSEHRAKDVVSTGHIRRVPQPAELEWRPACATTYADLGLWYDALESVSDSIEAAPGDRALRSQRSSLLRQAGLEAAIDE